MASSSQIETKTADSAAEATLAKSLAPEEIRRGDFVTPLHVVAEMPSWFWFCETWTLPVDEPVRVRFMASNGGQPTKVMSICLPFVLVRTPTGERQALDIRRVQLARLNPRYAKRTWKAQKKMHRRAKRSNRNEVSSTV
jgi:hypothetical protein